METILSFLKKIKDSLSLAFSKIYFKIKHFNNWIVKSIQYSIFLWNDYDWDWSYIFTLFQYKLKRTRVCIEKSTTMNESYQKRIVKQLKYSEFLLERIIKDEYINSLMNKHKQKWGEHIMWFTPCENGMRQLHQTYKRIVTEEDKMQERQDFLNMMNEEERLKAKDVERLFRHIEKYYRYWWD